MAKILEMFGEPISYGGQESVVYNMLSSFDEKDNFSIDLFTPYYSDNKNLIDLIKKRNGNIYSLNIDFKTGDNRFRLYKPVKKFFIRLKSRMNGDTDNNIEYDVAHIHTGSLTTMYVFAKIAKDYGIKKIIVHSHIGCLSGGILGKIRRLVLNILLKKYVDYFVGCSKEAIDAKFDGENNRSAILVCNGIDIDKFKYNENYRKEIRNKYSMKDEFVIGSLGRINKQKNLLFLLKVFNEITKIDDSIKLLIVGDGDNFILSELKDYIVNNNLSDKVVLCGRQIEAYKFYNAFDMFVLPSYYEGMPVTSIEAQVAGLPLLVSDKVTKECCISSTTQFLPITDSIIWAKKIIEIKNSYRYIKPVIDFDRYDRNKTFNIIKQLYNNNL